MWVELTLAAALLLVLLITLLLLWRPSDSQLRKQRRLQRYGGLTVASAKQSHEENLFSWQTNRRRLSAWFEQRWSRLQAVVGRVVLKRLGIGAGLTLLALLLMTDGVIRWWSVAALLVSVLLGLAGLYAWLERRERRLFAQHFPEAIGLIARAVGAGLSLPQAFAHVAESVAAPVGPLFARIHAQLQIGQTIEQALSEAVARRPASELKFFAVAVVLNQKSGGQLREVLSNLDDTMRERRIAAQKTKTMTAEPRLSAYAISLFPFVFLAGSYWILPTHFHFLLHHPDGKWLLGYAALSILLGQAVIFKLMRVG